MAGRVHVEADDVLDLGSEGRIGGAFEGAQSIGLEAVGVVRQCPMQP